MVQPHWSVISVPLVALIIELLYYPEYYWVLKNLRERKAGEHKYMHTYFQGSISPSVQKVETTPLSFTGKWIKCGQ